MNKIEYKREEICIRCGPIAVILSTSNNNIILNVVFIISTLSQDGHNKVIL